MYQAGQYWGVLQEWGCNKADTGTPFIFLVFEITHYKSGDSWEVETPANRTIRLFSSSKAWPYTKEKLQNLGFDGDDFPSELYEQGLRLNCNHETYEGETKERWDIPGGGGGAPENDPQMADQLKRKWKAEFGSQPRQRNEEPTTNGQTEPQGAQQTTGAVDDDDIPF